MGRNSCDVKQKLRKGLWSPEEDEKLYDYITRFGVGCWSSVPKLAGLQRCGKSCRLRWLNYLRPDLKRGMFSQEEEEVIISLHKALGNRWAKIASELPGRTDNEIKNFWNSSIKKKLMKQGIDPNTHTPITEDCMNTNSLQILQPNGHQNPQFSTRMEKKQDHHLDNIVYGPMFLSEFQESADHNGYYSVLPYDGLSSMPDLTSFDGQKTAYADCSDSSASRMSVWMMNEARESSKANNVDVTEDFSTLLWDGENMMESVSEFQFGGEETKQFVNPS